MTPVAVFTYIAHPNIKIVVNNASPLGEKISAHG
jgi:hypothetical protein